MGAVSTAIRFMDQDFIPRVNGIRPHTFSDKRGHTVKIKVIFVPKMRSAMEESEILKSFEERGILRAVESYRSVRDNIRRMIRGLEELDPPETLINEIRVRFNDLVKRAVSASSLIRESDEAFMRSLSEVIKDMTDLQNRISIIMIKLRSLKKKLEKLEAIYASGEISETAYRKVRSDLMRDMESLLDLITGSVDTFLIETEEGVEGEESSGVNQEGTEVVS